jgi:hypothetical protein
MGLEELFRPKSLEEHLESALESIKRNYRKHTAQVTAGLVKAGVFIVPYLTQESYEGRCEELIGMIRALKPEQTLIIPHDAAIFPDFSRRKLSKRHNLTTTTRFYSTPEENKRTSEALVKAALRGLSLADTRVGLDFKGVHESNRAYRVFTLLDCIRAQIADKKLSEDAVTIDLYIDAAQIWERGGDVHAVVPSFSSDRTYELDLIHIPIYRRRLDERVVRTSFDFYSTDPLCKRADYFVIKYGRKIIPVFGMNERKGDEILLDHHTILAFKRAKRKIKQIYGYGVVDPFPEPDKRTEEFFWKLMNNVLIESREDGHIKRQPVGDVNVFMEIMLQKFVGYRNKAKAQPSSSEL